MKNFNISIGLLKLVSCFVVVASHFGNVYSIFFSAAVPVFMFLSFYLCSDKFFHRDISLVILRIKHLLFPFLFWGVLSVMLSAAKDRDFGASFLRKLTSQLLFGGPTNSPLYFVLFLMVFSLMVYFIAKVRIMAIRMGIISCVVCLCFVLQYTGINYKIVINIPYLSSFQKIICGRLVELLPVAFFGVLCGVDTAKSFAQRHRLTLVTIGFVMTLISAMAMGVHHTYFRTYAGFAYGGLPLSLFSISLCLPLIILAEMWNNVPVGIVNLIRNMSGLTFGIYLTHGIIGGSFRLVTGLPKSILTVFFVVLMSAIFSAGLKRIKWSVT